MSRNRRSAERGLSTRTASSIALLTLFLASTSFVEAQEDTFVCFDNGIDGDSVDANHTGWIDAYGIDYGASSPYGSATVTLEDVSFLKGFDRASPQLYSLLTNSLTLPKVVIDVCRYDGGPQDCYSKLVLENVRVVQVDTAGSGCVDTGTSCTPAKTESVSLGFERITWVHPTLDYCWDTTTLLACTTVPTTDCTP